MFSRTIGIYLFFIYSIGLGTSAKGTRSEKSECDHDLLTSMLHNLANNHTHISRLLSIGKSVEGRDIWVMILSDSPQIRPLLRPQVKFVANINGYSGSACYLLLRLIKHLIEGYEIEGSVERSLLQNNEIHVIPNINPDGFSRVVSNSCFDGAGRFNANGANLNRNFPYVFENDERSQREPETEAIMRWTQQNNFVLSISLISGAFVVTYPFDSIPLQEDGEPFPKIHLTPDDNIFKHLALTYVNNVPGDPWYCPSLERVFLQGITNGAEWNPARGTMMDYNYLQGTFELMIGVSCCRNPEKQLLPPIWEQHGQALMEMIKETEYGVRGQVIDGLTGEVLLEAELLTSEHGVPWFTSPQGEFWKPMTPGKYDLTVKKEGYEETTIPFEISLEGGTILTIRLDRYSLHSTDSSITSSTTTTTTTTVLRTMTTENPKLKETSTKEPDTKNVTLLNDLEHSPRNVHHTVAYMLAQVTSSVSTKSLDLTILFFVATLNFFLTF